MSRNESRDDESLSTIGERLRAVRNKLGTSQTDMAEQVGVSQGTLADYESGRRKPSMPVLLALEHCFHINHQWVLSGKGDPLRTESAARPVITVDEEERARLENLEGRDSYYAIPYLRDAAAAGSGLLMEEDVAGYCIIHKRVAPRPDELRCVRISGSSMSPTLTDGSIVAINTTIRDVSAVTGKIVCARTSEGEVVIKRLRHRGRHVLLYSDNPVQEKYPPLVVDLREVENPIVGQVVWAWVDLR